MLKRSLLVGFLFIVQIKAAYWLQDASLHNGIAPFNADPANYKVFRNVKDFGAKGDGTIDDTDAINKALSDGDRCGVGCNNSMTTPALVYVPSGTYLISKPLVLLYMTQLVGDPTSKPVLKAAAAFEGMALIDANPYLDGGANVFVNQNNFFKEFRNFVVDLRDAKAGTGVHWQVSQATSLTNVDFVMAEGSEQQGVFIDNGSLGMIADLSFTGGSLGILIGNQQATLRNLRFTNVQTAMRGLWNWSFVFYNITITGSSVGLEQITGTESKTKQGANIVSAIDWTVKSTKTAVSMTVADSGNLIIENMATESVEVIVASANKTLLDGSASGTKNVESWIQGQQYIGDGAAKALAGGSVAVKRSQNLIDSTGKWFGKNQNQYNDAQIGDFQNVKSCGAKGDGKTDDTANLQNCFDQYAKDKIMWFPAGIYVLTATLKIPKDTRMFGEIWSTLQGGGDAFADETNPKPVLQFGQPGDTGTMEVSNFFFSTSAGSAGAIVAEWNIAQSQPGSASLHSSHVLLGGYAGSGLQKEQCSKDLPIDAKKCSAAFLGLHITAKASAYIEGSWVWLADHDLEIPSSYQINVLAGRGTLIESTDGPVWLYGGGSEHFLAYQYHILNAKNVLLGLIQTESPYFFGGDVTASSLVKVSTAYNDPAIGDRPLGLRVASSDSITIYGAGLYSFFDDNYKQDCLNTSTCQSDMASFDGVGGSVALFGLATIGITNQISVDGKAVALAKDNLLGGGVAQGLAVWTSPADATVSNENSTDNSPSRKQGSDTNAGSSTSSSSAKPSGSAYFGDGKPALSSSAAFKRVLNIDGFLKGLLVFLACCVL